MLLLRCADDQRQFLADEDPIGRRVVSTSLQNRPFRVAIGFAATYGRPSPLQEECCPVDLAFRSVSVRKPWALHKGPSILMECMRGGGGRTQFRMQSALGLNWTP